MSTRLGLALACCCCLASCGGSISTGDGDDDTAVPPSQPGASAGQQSGPTSPSSPAPSAPTPSAPAPHSCADVLAQSPGSTDGLYEIELAGTPVTVYCDMTRDGGGWTLVINAPTAGYASMPEIAPPLRVDTHGQLPPRLIAALLSKPTSAGNNVRVRIDDPALVISMRATLDNVSSLPRTSAPTHTFRVDWQANGNCAAFDDGPDVASVARSDGWFFLNGSNNGNIGYGDFSSRGSFAGFHTNYDTHSDRTCNRTTTPGAWRPGRAGSLWLR